MNLRSVLNRLTEEELELIQEEIEGDLYEEIDKVIDDKRQPSLFTQDCNEGDVYIEQGPMRSNYVHKIKGAKNPYYSVETIFTVNGRIVHNGYCEYKASQILHWQKVAVEAWDYFKSLIDLKDQKIVAVNKKMAKDFNIYWEQLREGGK